MAQSASIRASSPFLGTRSRAGVAILLVVVGFVVSWWAVGRAFPEASRLDDTPLYMSYAIEMRRGAVPYRDFAVEYPPGALAVFAAPALVARSTAWSAYSRAFGWVMAACGLVLAGVVLMVRPERRTLVILAVLPALVGYVIEARFDLFPALLVAAAVAAFLHDRHRLGWLALALAIAVKLYAVVLVPLAVVWTLRRRGRRELRNGLVVACVTSAAVFGPFFAVAPRGMWESIWGQLSRPLQIESLAGSLLTTFAHPEITNSHSSDSIVGHGWLAGLSTAIELACLVGLWVGFARGRIDEERFLRYCAGCVVAFVAFGKVLSPQYVIWLLPLVTLVAGLRGLLACGLLAVATVATQFWVTTDRYSGYVAGFHGAPIVLGRNLLLVATLAVLAAPLDRLRAGEAPQS